jgi:potassium uptake TrkH family protein
MALRRAFNLIIFKRQKLLSRLLRIIIFLVSILAILGLVYYHGFNHTHENKELIFGIIKLFYGFFILNFLLKLFFTFDRMEFVRANWFEMVLLLIVVYDVISNYLFGVPLLHNIFFRLGIRHLDTIYTLFIQFYLLILVFFEFIRNYKDFNRVIIKPSTLFILSFVLLIVTGGLILSLPAMNTTGKFLNLTDAIFTAASAGCVTGLSVVDTEFFFSRKGQIVILVLIQLGGIGILTFATFFATFIKKGIGLHHENALKSLTDSESLLGAHGLLRPIVFFTLTIEGIASLALYSLWGDTHFSSVEEKIFCSVFHAVSAFNNAGFSLFTDGLHTPLINQLYVLHLMVAVTIFFGSLGFPAIKDMFNRHSIKIRLAEPWRQWKLSTRIAFFTGLLLVILGALAFYILEKDNTLLGMNPVEAAITSIFQSTTTRTAGFNTVVIGDCKTPTIFIMMFLMFIGAASGSTGGGIKTSTFVIIFLAIWGIIKGRKHFTLGRRNIPKELILKAFTIFIFSATFVFLMIFCLTFTDNEKPLITLIFESISAFGTVGLTMGITMSLSVAGKWIIIFTMFVGRVGLLSLALSLSTEEKTVACRYPDTHIMIG